MLKVLNGNGFLVFIVPKYTALLCPNTPPYCAQIHRPIVPKYTADIVPKYTADIVPKYTADIVPNVALLGTI